MDLLIVLGYVMALLIGVTLGLVGSGGSILTVPVLVYMMGFDAVTATGYSLFVVGSSAMVGGIRNLWQKEVDLKIVAIFGIPSMLMAYLMRAFLLPVVPENLATIGSRQITKPQVLLVLFAMIMLIAAYKMIRATPITAETGSVSPVKLALSGIVTGIVAGAVGAGGGFLIIPALFFLARLPMKTAVGTSLVIIAIQSLAGFAGEAAQSTDWTFLAIFTSVAVAGIFLGLWLSKKMHGETLKTGFGYFILLMGIFILVQELFIK